MLRANSFVFAALLSMLLGAFRINAGAVTFILTAASDNSAYIWNSTNNPTFNVEVGQDYRFELGSDTMALHPFTLYDQSNAIVGVCDLTGCSLSPTAAMTSLRYQCFIHPAMKGTFTFTGTCTCRLNSTSINSAQHNATEQACQYGSKPTGYTPVGANTAVCFDMPNCAGSCQTYCTTNLPGVSLTAGCSSPILEDFKISLVNNGNTAYVRQDDSVTQNPTITVDNKKTYSFQLNSAVMASHPFLIKDQNGIVVGTPTYYDRSITIDCSIMTSLTYVCGNHPAMTGKFIITGCPVAPSSSSSSCFPGFATVVLMDGSVVAMEDLRVGDKVLVGGGQYSEVFMFSHRYPEAQNAFIQLHSAKDGAVTLSAGHYLYVNGKMATASSVVVGDFIESGNGGTYAVVAITMVTATGLYNPHTLHGDVVVNGFRTSTYTDALHPVLAHSILAPARAMYLLNFNITGP